MFASSKFSGWDIVLVLAIAFLLFGSRRLPELFRGLREGMNAFKNVIHEITDQAAFDAGRSAGGVYGKAAAQALAQDNQAAELYDPEVLQKKPNTCKERGFLGVCVWISRLVKKIFSVLARLFISRQHP